MCFMRGKEVKQPSGRKETCTKHIETSCTEAGADHINKVIPSPTQTCFFKILSGGNHPPQLILVSLNSRKTTEPCEQSLGRCQSMPVADLIFVKICDICVAPKF